MKQKKYDEQLMRFYARTKHPQKLKTNLVKLGCLPSADYFSGKWDCVVLFTFPDGIVVACGNQSLRDQSWKRISIKELKSYVMLRLL